MPRRRFASATSSSATPSTTLGEPAAVKSQQRAADQLAVGRHRVARAEAGVGEESPPVHRDGGQDAGRAVRGSGDHPAAGGVLLVDGERERAEPLAGQLAAPVVLRLLELLADRADARRLTCSSPGSTPSCVQPRLDAGRHRIPDAVEPGGDLFVGAQRLLVDARGFGDRDAALVAQLQQRLGAVERERVRVRRDPRRLALPPDEPAADRVVRLAQHKPLGVAPPTRTSRPRAATPVVRTPAAASRAAVGIRNRRLGGPRLERHRVRVGRQPHPRRRRPRPPSRKPPGACRRARAAAPPASRSTRRARHPGPPSRARGPAGRRPPHRVCRGRSRSRRASRTACR